MASKVHEDTMTYLNQGQSYEIKFKKLGGLELQGNILKSVIRVGFQERRLQYMEKDLLAQWKRQRSNERIIEIDIPLSYGVFEIIHPDDEINCVKFSWDPNVNKDSGIFIKLNAISTEFTPKKHGGEKGVPFKLMIETQMYNNNSPISQNAFVEGASCQVKVFKPKGADRKHKTDREKMAKRSMSEQQKYLPSCDYTLFKPCIEETLFLNNNLYNSNQLNTNGDTNRENDMGLNYNLSMINNLKVDNLTSVDETFNEDQTKLINTKNPFIQNEDCKSNLFTQNNLNLNIDNNNNISNINNNMKNNFVNIINHCSSSCGASFNQMNQINSSILGQNALINTPLTPNMDTQRVRDWLFANRFEKYYPLFQMFNSNDILNLSRKDLVEICDLTDGIRLYNSLHIKVKKIQPKITIYLCFENDLFKACYLNSYKYDELKEKLLKILSENSKIYDYDVLMNKLKHILIIGPNQIKILVTEDVISNLAKESIYLIRTEQEVNSEKYDLILKPYIDH